MKFRRIKDKPTVLITVLLAFLTIGRVVLAESPSVIEVADFSAEKTTASLPAHWEPFYFKDIKRHTDYRLVEEDGQVVVRAVADGSASGLKRKITIDPKEYPIVQWRWRAANTLKKANIYQKEGDDYPARIYISFKYDPHGLGFFEKTKYRIARMLYGEYPPLAAINYVWASKAPVGLAKANSYTDRVMMMVVESGAKNLNRWINEERDIYADYRNTFRKEPPMISGVAIMTDTDNTGESATAYYGDIQFHKRRR
ncbi:MAG: DUF3047 domain-containing protein [Deltaproteobacteria bacterium]|jgi:hypothetical protein